ncbi:MAG TPA: hypothetical protein VJ813_08995 [Vicinamibacterales bacterium]|nr:hypothetical protein [Vicinamibacterales bacterium]
MQRLTRRERLLVGIWIVLAIALWNGVYDMTLGEGIKEYLFRSALHEAGRGPRMSIATVLDPFILDAVWVSTFWASLVLLLGLVTIRALRRHDGTSR